MIANHAGYNVVEMNASDDRSLEAFRTKLDSATQMRSVNSRDQGGNSIDIFGVLRHILTCSALVLNLAQNMAQFGA